MTVWLPMRLAELSHGQRGRRNSPDGALYRQLGGTRNLPVSATTGLTCQRIDHQDACCATTDRCLARSEHG